MFTFKTEILGIKTTVEGEFVEADYELNDAGGFEIHAIKCNGEEFDLGCIDDGALDAIGAEALIEAAKAVLI